MCLTSTSEMVSRCQRRLVRSNVPKMSFNARWSVQNRGMTLVRRRSSSKVRAKRFVVRTYFRWVAPEDGSDWPLNRPRDS